MDENCKRVELVMQALAVRLPGEWEVRPSYDEYFKEYVLYIQRLVADLDSERVDTEYDYVAYRHPVTKPSKPIDYLRVWLTSTFPFLTASFWQPQFTTKFEWGETSAAVRHIHTVKKIVARPGTRTYSYYE